MLEHPSISKYQSVKILDCGQSAGNSLKEALND